MIEERCVANWSFFIPSFVLRFNFPVQVHSCGKNIPQPGASQLLDQNLVGYCTFWIEIEPYRLIRQYQRVLRDRDEGALAEDIVRYASNVYCVKSDCAASDWEET